MEELQLVTLVAPAWQRVQSHQRLRCLPLLLTERDAELCTFLCDNRETPSVSEKKFSHWLLLPHHLYKARRFWYLNSPCNPALLPHRSDLNSKIFPLILPTSKRKHLQLVLIHFQFLNPSAIKSQDVWERLSCDRTEKWRLWKTTKEDQDEEEEEMTLRCKQWLLPERLVGMLL